MARRGTLVMGTAGGPKENVAFDFSDDEWVLLERFAARVDELMDSAAVRAVFDGGVSIAWDHQTGWKPVDKSRLPSKDDLNAFLGYLRPIILETEPWSFQRAMTIIGRCGPRSAWKAIRDRYNGARYERMFSVSVTLPAGADDPSVLVLNARDTLRLWINAFGYHEDTDKVAMFERFFRDGFPTPDHVRGFAIEMLIEKAIAAIDLREVIGMFQAGPGASCVLARRSPSVRPMS